MTEEIRSYNERQEEAEKAVCNLLAKIISEELTEAENKIWHAHPVWFLEGNPIVGYSKQKKGIRLMFWSGSDFDEEMLNVRGQKFKDASVFYSDVSEVDTNALVRCLEKSRRIQWDYKNVVKRKGKLVKLNV
jgi:uncharacterized protein YdhG (YjbR/CyaY superfamily)